MKDPRIQIWNVLHDGEIASVSPENAQAIVMFVAIPYLRRSFEPMGASFVLSLSGVTRFEFQHFDGEVTSLDQALRVGGPQILSAGSESMPVTVETSMGQLRLDFQSLSLSLDTGQSIRFDALHDTAEGYWAALRARADR